MYMNISRNIPIFLISAVLVFGTTISIGNPPSFAQPSYYEQPEYHIEDPYTKTHNKLPIIQNNKCNNIIINSIDKSASHLQGNMLTEKTGENDVLGAQDQWSGNDYDDELNDIDRNIVTCTNINNNAQVEHAQQQPGSLTVKKEVFGCESQANMDCQDTDIDSPDWVSCDNPDISNTPFCENLPRNFFDIEVLDEQNTQIQQFKGSQEGTTIPNLEPGMYSVNEIREDGAGVLNPTEEPQLADCNNGGFPESGQTFIDGIFYEIICIAYEDEQGADCSTTNIAAGENKTCIVKNYIRFASEL